MKITIHEMTCEAFHSKETLLLETANSIYRFSVIDATHCIGKLSGGIFGDRPATASFLSSISAQEDYRAEDFGKIKVGARAIFIFLSNEGFHHFITSPIIKLTPAKQALAE